MEVSQVIKLFAKLVSPEILMLAEKQKLSAQQIQQSLKASEKLQPCDLILTQTPGRNAQLVRSLMNTQYDHIAVYIDKERCLQVGVPKARFIKSHLVLTQQRKPLVLRANLDQQQKESYLKSLLNLIDTPYNYSKTLSVLFSLFMKETFNYIIKSIDDRKDKIICTNSILQAHPRYTEIILNSKSLDFITIGSASFNDFQKLAANG